MIPIEDLDQVHLKDVHNEDDDDKDGGDGSDDNVGGDIGDGDKPALCPPGAQLEIGAATHQEDSGCVRKSALKLDSVKKHFGYKLHEIDEFNLKT